MSPMRIIHVARHFQKKIT
ncbi:hypothetical protein TKK_0018447 [Trichogramma kaykai]